MPRADFRTVLIMNKADACAPVAQLDRADDFESSGREFEPLRARQPMETLARLGGAAGNDAARL